MTSSFKIQRIIAFLLNGLFIGLFFYFVVKNDSDKSPVVFMFFYPLLTMINLLFYLVLWWLKKAAAKIYLQANIFWTFVAFYSISHRYIAILKISDYMFLLLCRRDLHKLAR